ncbi:MAG: TlyA family RNA methyltransferase [Proteobacteria bacterium]|nr:TlyA family RNA methyltransferase [Pseudomonadota bacterium]
MRADLLLVEQGIAPTRSAAQRLIERGAVRWLASDGWRVPKKAGEPLPEGCAIEVTDDAELRWASRGGLKLDAALARVGLDARGLRCLDVGQSTGGFTDVLLARGASEVAGIDVGHDQLVPRLRADPRVRAIEGLNARDIASAGLGSFDLVVGDLSFISLALVLPALAPLVAGELLMLVKPQFELQPADIGKGGLVKDAASYAKVEARIRAACADAGLAVVDYFESAIAGGDGNHEFFVRARPALPRRP